MKTGCLYRFLTENQSAIQLCIDAPNVSVTHTSANFNSKSNSFFFIAFTIEILTASRKKYISIGCNSFYDQDRLFKPRPFLNLIVQ